MDFDASEIFKAWNSKYGPGGFKAMIKYSLTSPVFHPPECTSIRGQEWEIATQAD
jgi:hypothetical protein